MADQPSIERKPLREWRRLRGYTQMRLAADIGVNLATIGNLETGRNRPNFDTWRAIAVKLDISMDQIEWPAEIRPYPSKVRGIKMAGVVAA